MGAAASSSSSSSKKYDVFISFRGEDTRSNFTSHLHAALCQNSIETYIDYKLQKGDDISQSLIEAIQDSSISVVIFSENYGSSKWCLDELVQILDCRKYMGQVVIPVFYKVDPSDVRKQKGSFMEAFAKHETDFIHNRNKVTKWRDALFETANIAGWDSQTYRDESELIRNIVNDVLQKLNLGHPTTFDSVVGIEDNCKHIELLLEKVPIIGIWGMGGIGKTTLAKVVFDKIRSEYDSYCFLENLREKSEKHGLTYVRNELLFELQKQMNNYDNTSNVVGSSIFVRRLRNKKVLIVLDDVNSSKQLEYFSQEFNCLGPNSRVIITTRDRHLLVRRVSDIYEAKTLNYQASLKLFNLNAFHKDHSEIGYEELSKWAVDYAQGVPLVLVVLGTFLRSKTEEEWKSAFEKLKKYPHRDIQEVLKLSYDGLDHEEREMFLDIACFLKGEVEDHVKSILDGFGFNASIGLRTLIDRALITVDSNTVWMHDLIQKMGWEIVLQENIKHPGRRSRLWDPAEVFDVLKENNGTDSVEGIIFDISQNRDICLSADTFKKMTNLRYLRIFSKYRRSGKVNLPSGLESLSDKLSYLCWDGYPLECPPSTFSPKKLVELHMEGSQVKKLWDGVQDIVNLRKVNLRRCKNLLVLPDFSNAKRLEMVDLSECENLNNVHPSIISLHTLVTLNLSWCKRLQSLQSETHLKSLENLDVCCCFVLKKFSLSSEKITVLELASTGIELLHPSIQRLNKLRRLYLNGSTLKNVAVKELSWLSPLEKLSITNCRQLIDEPNLQILFDGLRSLKDLHLEGCSNLSTIPDNITNVLSLSALKLDGSNIESLPSTIKHLLNLKVIQVSNCGRLQSIAELPPCISYLDATNCVSLETVVASTTFEHDGKDDFHRFLFNNCVSLDENSFNMEFVELSMKRAAYNNCRVAEVCYAGSKIPEWFVYKEKREAIITVEIDTPFNDLKGFLLCSLVSPLILEEQPNARLVCHFYLEGYQNLSSLTERHCPMMHPEFDNVIICYHPFHIRSFPNNRKVTIEFKTTNTVGDPELKKFIKACGVYPIYDSHYHSFLQQMKTNRPLDIDDLPPTKKFKQT